MRDFVFALENQDGTTSTWTTNGTAAGTIELSGPTGPSISIPADFQFWGNNLLFSSGYGLYVTNAAGGTTQLGGGNPTSYIPFGNSVLIASVGLGSGSQLYVSNGTYAGTVPVDFPDGLTTITSDFTSIGTAVLFTGTDGAGYEALFATDGTGAGSHEISRPLVLGASNQAYDPTTGSSVITGAGDDTISASGTTTIFGGAGSTTIFGGAGGGIYTGGAAGNNVLVSGGASGANSTLTGALTGDRIFGSAAGDDLLIVGSGRESVLGGGGNTTVEGGMAASVIFTGSGPSSVLGGVGGGDTIVGGAGTLAVTAQYGDAIFGNAGALDVTGSASGADSIIGGSGALSVSGIGGNMLVVAGGSTSQINVGTGASLIFAGSGATSVTGGPGSLQVVVGSGQGTFAAGSGAASFDVVKGAAGGTEMLIGFKPGIDTIDLFGYGGAIPAISISGGSSLVTLSDGTNLHVIGVTNIADSIVSA